MCANKLAEEIYLNSELPSVAPHLVLIVPHQLPSHASIIYPQS